jgi:hypothetical protein
VDRLDKAAFIGITLRSEYVLSFPDKKTAPYEKERTARPGSGREILFRVSFSIRKATPFPA